MRMAVDARGLSDELGLTGTHVFFNEGWVDYDDRQNYLLEADIGVSTHLDHVETALSFRTRILDYLWASLPMVATRGDSLADLIERAGPRPHGAAGRRRRAGGGAGRACSTTRASARRAGENVAGVVPDLRVVGRPWRRWWSSAAPPGGRPTSSTPSCPGDCRSGWARRSSSPMAGARTSGSRSSTSAPAVPS